MPKKPNPDTICAAAITAMSVAASGDVAPCCEYDGKIGSLREKTLREIWQDKPLQELRRKLAAGTKAKACWKCWQAEKAGTISLRKRFNNIHESVLPKTCKTTDFPDPEYLDFRFSNLCNFRCRTCYHGASSRWFSDAKAMGKTEGSKALLSAFDSDADGLLQFNDIGQNITDLYFAGGEPLMEQQYYDLLQNLIANQKTDIRLSFNTNLSLLNFEGHDLVNMWKNFKHLYIEVSIDAIGDAGALIRKGFDWQVMKDNLARLKKEIPHMELHIGVTVSVLNILHIVELHKTLVADCEVDTDMFNFHAVQNPKHYDISILPKDIKEKASVQIEAYVAQLYAQDRNSRTARFLALMVDRMDRKVSAISDSEQTELRKEFRAITAQLDKLRREKTVDILPELRSLIEG